MDDITSQNTDGLHVAPHAERPIDPHSVIALLHDEGWWPNRSEKDMSAILRVSPAAGAWRHGQLVGFARAVTDGVERAYIEDVVVHREIRHNKIGSDLLGCLLEQISHVRMISLFCTTDLVPFYELGGFWKTSQIVLHRSNGA